jgi:solute carrier family 15 oligopeptide transporter 1
MAKFTGVPGILMLFAFVLFLAGWRFYKIGPANQDNPLWKCVKCIGHAIRHKFSRKQILVINGHEAIGQKSAHWNSSSSSSKHWLDCAIPKYGAQLVTDVKSLLAIIVLFVPMAMFWALGEQQAKL